MPKAERLPSGTYRTKVYVGVVDGVKKFETFLGETKDEVEFLAAKYKMDQKKKSADAKKPLEERMTVGEAISQHISNIEGVLSPTTVRRYKEDRKKFFSSIMNTIAI